MLVMLAALHRRSPRLQRESAPHAARCAREPGHAGYPYAIKALLVSRALLIKIKRDIENQIRGLLKNLGLVIGRAKMNVFFLRAAQLTEAPCDQDPRSAAR
jgi:hypothetical protein